MTTKTKKGFMTPLQTIEFDANDNSNRWSMDTIFKKNKNRYIESCTLKNAIEKKSKIRTNDGAYFFCDNNRYGCWFCVRDNFIYSLNDNYNPTNFREEGEAIGVVIKFKGKNHILVNADEDGSTPHEFTEFLTSQKIPHVMFSFNCLFRLALQEKPQVTETILREFSKEKPALSIVDCEGEDTIPLTPEQIKIIKKKGGDAVPVPQGYTLINGLKFHKSPTTLIFDSKANKTYLMGQDEGQYFGCELTDNPKTIKQANVSLKPVEARIVDCKRQGEWFFLPVNEDDLPDVQDRLLELNSLSNIIKIDEKVIETGNDISLGRESKESNKHKIHANAMFVAKNGSVYALNPKVSHTEHKAVIEEGWIKFLKNTAVRSVSVDGVD